MDENVVVKWPPFVTNKKIEKMVIDEVEPSPNWKDCLCIIKYLTKSYDKAEKKLDYYLSNSDVDLVTSCDETPETPTHIFASPRIPERNRSSCSNCATMKENVQKTEAYLQKILTTIEDVQARQEQLSEIVTKYVGSEHVSTIPKINYLPIMTIESLKEVNETLLQNEIEFGKVVMVLGLLGGKDAPEAIRKILSKVMTTDVAMQINWQGGSKVSLQEFPAIVQLVAVSLRQNPRFEAVTQDDVEKVIKPWLRSAPDRDGGRNKRRKLTLENKL